MKEVVFIAFKIYCVPKLKPHIQMAISIICTYSTIWWKNFKIISNVAQKRAFKGVFEYFTKLFHIFPAEPEYFIVRKFEIVEALKEK